MTTLTLEPNVEGNELCQSRFLDNPHELLVTEVGMQNQGGYHHSNWFFVPVGTYDVPSGVWDCDEYGFDDFEAAVKGGLLFAQTTQSKAEVQRFPPGAAIRIPPYSVIIGDTHVRNTTGKRLTTRMTLRLETAPRDRVTTLLTPTRFTYFDLHIPPGSRSAFTAECDLAGAYRQATDAPFQYTIHYVLPHYHELGAYAELGLVGGPLDGELLHRHDGFGSNFGRAFNPPVDLVALGATGLRFTCGYENTTEEAVEYGIHGHEMCVFALFADTGVAFDAKVPEGSGNVVERTEDGVTVHTGPCELVTVPWTQDKPGGEPRQVELSSRGR